MAGQEPAESDIHQGNWYVLVMGLPRPEEPLTLAPGLTLLEQGEVLAVYQHAAHKTNWIGRSTLRMEGACLGGNVRSIVGNVAGDVSILWAVKEAV